VNPLIVAHGKTLILVAAVCLSSFPPHPPAQTDRIRLEAILKRSEEYFRRLDKAALDFVCLEEVRETSRYYASDKDGYLHDYQFNRSAS
jgi:hypothetical protein